MARTMLLVEATPNPDALRIALGATIWSGPTVEVRSGEDCADVPLAQELLAIDGIAGVLIGRDFVTIRRASSDQSWDIPKREALAVVADLLLSGRPAVSRARQASAAAPVEDDPVLAQIEEVLERFVRPMLARDGGEATLLSFDREAGLVRIRMGGACGGCPSGRMTLKRGIEQTLMRYVPEIARVEAEGERQADADPKARFRAWIKEKWG